MRKITILAPPHILAFFKLHQHNALQKISFCIMVYDYENENLVQIEKLEKCQVYCFHPFHIGVLWSKTLTLNRNPNRSNFDNFHIFQHFFFLKNMNMPNPM